MVSVGITGGIGSGKSTVCRFWEEMGAYVLNADELAKQVMVTNPDVRRELKQAFGASTYKAGGGLNRSHLAREAFEKGRVGELNAIVHPRLPEASRQKMREARERGHAVFVYEAALLLENLQPGRLDYLVLVLADQKQRMRRVRQRDKSTVDEIKARMNNQRNFEEATGLVDYVIRNNGTLRELRSQAEQLYEKFLESA